MSKYFFLFIILTSCLQQQKKAVNIFIDPKNHGWYFIELDEDSTMKSTTVVNVRIDSIFQLSKIKISSYYDFTFSVFDGSGKDMSANLKLPGYLSNYDGRHYFKFYNPTELELKEIQKWNPTDAGYMEIDSKSRMQLKIMTQKKVP